LIPLALLVARTWQLRTRGQREEAAEVRAARKRVEQELAQAAKTPARDAAGPLAAALRAYARALGRELDDQGLLARLETESFAPSAAASPLSADVRVGVESLVRRWASPKRAAAGKLTAVGALLAIALAPATARADTLEDGRAAYQDALGLSDASAKRAAFARAAAQLGEAARTEPDRAELLADWGNASLGAGDVATATLAFRRALALDASNMRARRNLAWLRSRQPDALRPGGDSASDTLFFFHQWPRARRLVVGAFAFAFAVLLVVPWGGRRRRGLVGLALLPLVVWIAMGASLLLEDHHRDDAIVMDAVVLRAADAAGAPAASSEPLPRGAEVTIVERRDAWTRVRLASGAAGWVQAGAIEPVATR
jgi:tetratricopeptide (TPR) repeat protein